MSQKQKAWLRLMESQRRDAEPCANCGHSRGLHIGEKNCAFRQIKQCECPAFVPKGVAA